MAAQTWLVIGADERDPVHRELFSGLKPSFGGTVEMGYGASITCKDGKNVLHFRNYLNQTIKNRDRTNEFKKVWEPGLGYVIELPFRQTYFCRHEIPGSEKIKHSKELTEQTRTWIYDTFFRYPDSKTRENEANIRCRFLGPPHNDYNQALHRYTPNQFVPDSPVFSAMFCAIDTILMHKWWAIDDFQLRLYHALYHGYRQGSELKKDQCILRAMKELQLTHNFGEASRNQVPDTYTSLWYPLTQAIPLRLWFKDQADDKIREQCAITHNHEDYIYMACEYTKMLFDPDHNPSVERITNPERRSCFEAILGRNKAKSKEVSDLIDLVDRIKQYPFYNVLAGRNGLRPNDSVIAQRDELKDCDRFGTRYNMRWDYIQHLWNFDAECGKFDLSICMKDQTRLKVLELNNYNLCYQHPVNDKVLGIPYFQNQHMSVPRELTDEKFYVGKTEAFIKGLQLDVWSMSTEGSMCGRYFIQIIQTVLRVPITPIKELNTLVSRDLNQDWFSRGSDYRDENMTPIYELGFRNLRKQDMLWNVFDLKIAMNAVHLDVGVIAYMEALDTVWVVDFDRNYRPRRYPRYVVGMIEGIHWYFLTQNGSMFFTDQVLRLLPPTTHYYSIGPEAIWAAMLREKGAPGNIRKQ